MGPRARAGRWCRTPLKLQWSRFRAKALTSFRIPAIAASAVLLSKVMIPEEIDRPAAEVHEEALRRLGLSGRLRVALELSDLTHRFAIAGIRRDDPAVTEEEAGRRLAERLYGRAVD
jgi:hypothetical protein